MSLLRLTNKTVASLPVVTWLVLQLIYEPESMTHAEIELMRVSLLGWQKKFPLEEHEYGQLAWLKWMLEEDSKHLLDERKRLLKLHKIDWRRFHRLVPAPPEEVAKAQAAYKKYKAQNPEQES